MATTVEAEILRLPNDDEIEWRLECLESLGHRGKLALEVASSGIDLHDLLRMLEAGCDLTVAWKIRQPFEWELPPVAAQTVAAAS